MKKVLLIDDDNILADLYGRALKESGFEFIRAKNGQEGARMAQKQKPDLILLDVLIPEMTGPEVMLKLKSDEATKGIPVFFMTNLEGEQDTARFASEIGAIGYIIKSEISLKELVAKVKRGLGVKD